MKNDQMLLAWAASILQKAQGQEAYCTITFHLKDGEIVRAERNDSYIAPKAGATLSRTGG